jgi:SAM-dependent MidA family methyltransferase
MRAAWHAALYGRGGFYRTEQPADHFRTSTHVSRDFADAVLSIAHQHDVETVVDLGAGGGELLASIRSLDGELALAGVDVRPRPADLAQTVDWRLAVGDAGEALAAVASGPTLVIANELLDNIACDVVELTPDGLREVEVHSETGRERLGGAADPAAVDWIERWWPLSAPGQRAVVGLARDVAWARLCTSVAEGLCLAVDFGHPLADRPTTETPTSYRSGRQYPARFDGRHDITAPVAVDAVASAVGGRIERQRDVLRRRVSPPERPGVDLARSDPIGYLRLLSAAGDWRELTASSALGDFWWISSPGGPRAVAASAGLESEVAR